MLKTIRFRLTFLYVLFLLASFSALAVFFYQGLKMSAEKEIQRILDYEFNEISNFIVANYDQKNLILHELNQRTTLSGDRYKIYYALFDLSGNILAKSEFFAEDNAAVSSLCSHLEKGNILKSEKQKTIGKGYGEDPIHCFTKPLYLNEKPIYFLQLGVSLMQAENVLWEYFNFILFAIPVLLIIAGFGGYFLAGHYLKPIVKITQSAKDITINNFENYLPVRNTGDELDDLIKTFNDAFKRLAQSYKKISQFTQDASHELRIPLTTLKGEAQVVLERERNPEEYRKVLESSIEDYDRLTRMLNDLLILSRSDYEGQQFDMEAVDLSKLLSQMTEFFQVLADSKGIEIKSQLNENISIQGNQTLLERLFSNLLDNAIKYTLNQKPITITLQESDEQVSLSIQDQGVGIPSDCLNKIFDRFYRVEKSRARELGGVGLGLSIVKMAADIHQAEVVVESKEGSGTLITVHFPKNL